MTIFVSRDGNQIGEFNKDQFEAEKRSGNLLPTDHYWSDGMADWEVIGKAVAPPRPPPMSANGRPASSSPAGERTFYSRGRISVTESRFSVGSTMYPIRNISAVEHVAIPADRGAARRLGGAGGIVAIIALGASGDAKATLWTIALILFVMMAIALIGKKATFAVQILTGGGEKKAYISPNADVVREITTALNEAVVNYNRRQHA